LRIISFTAFGILLTEPFFRPLPALVGTYIISPDCTNLVFLGIENSGISRILKSYWTVMRTPDLSKYEQGEK
jgi:hypothetical protein